MYFPPNLKTWLRACVPALSYWSIPVLCTLFFPTTIRCIRSSRNLRSCKFEFSSGFQIHRFQNNRSSCSTVSSMLKWK